ncbi:hypothetical protein [Methylovorus sp. MM2]|uniref:hypothetical protein n=1 Tax=Methylovorus sp. MM2 TaxID=1848038 RepID=UPI0009ED4296|nr:hypothetical protein [Methylovorus sp. MM2]
MMRYWLVVVTFGFALANTAMAAESFGRLFTTPAERSNLDYLRQTSKVNVFKETETANPDETDLPTPPTNISVQGYVKRNDGKKGTVWINNQPMRENSANSNVQVGKVGADGNQVQIVVPGNGKNLNLKAGQVYTPDTGTVSEVATHAKPVSETGSIGNDGQQPAQPGNELR